MAVSDTAAVRPRARPWGVRRDGILWLAAPSAIWYMLFTIGPLLAMFYIALLDWKGDGRPYERFFDIAYEPFRDESGAVAGVMSFSFEVTEQVKARRKIEAIVQELESANRTKDEFLATVSHELRTPLQAILGWSRLLRGGQSGQADAGRLAKGLEVIDRNAKVQAQLIEDILDVSRIIAGKVRINAATVNIAAVVRAAIDTTRPAAEAKRIDVMAEIDPFDTEEPLWRQRAVSRSLNAARSRAEQRVQRFLDAAFELIDEKGTTEFTIQEVIDRSKQSLRGFYQYFDGKDELLFALLEETIRESSEDMRAAVESASDPLEKLRAFTVRLHEWCEPLGTRRQDTVTVFDIRAEKQLRFGDKARVGLFLDIYNLMNSNTAININWRAGAAFEKATTVLPPRIAKFGVKFNW